MDVRKLDIEDGRWTEVPQEGIQVWNLQGLLPDSQLYPTTKEQWLTDDKNCLLYHSSPMWGTLWLEADSRPRRDAKKRRNEAIVN
jgi:hypothetical protein